MNPPASIQLQFFQHLKSQLPPHLSMVDMIAELLDISTDSAYRRIRGEKPIDLEEAHKLCTHFNLSIDRLLHMQSDAFIFTGALKSANADTAFEDWLKGFLYNFQVVASYEKKHLYYLMKDIPPFVHFLVPELTAFKCYFWMKSILHDERLKGVKFSLTDTRYDKYREYSNKIIEIYNTIPVTEIWNIESLNSTLNQINFYVEAGSFANKKDAVILYEKVESLINHIEKQAEAGMKFPIGAKPLAGGSYRMVVNELILGDNTVLAELGDTRLTFLNHSVLYFVATRDEAFNNAIFGNLENLIKKSTMVSTVGEKERERFFNLLRGNIYTRLSALP